MKAEHCEDQFPIKRVKIEAGTSFSLGAHYSFTLKSYPSMSASSTEHCFGNKITSQTKKHKTVLD